MTQQIYTIVLTGGPCAGKTTALVRIIEYFTSVGFKVFTIPEVPTMLSQSGIDYLTSNEEFFLAEEQATLRLQLQMEEHFRKIAQAYGKPSIIVCDRGAMDISAYLSAEKWDEITRAVGISTTELRDMRYDAVLHLVSAADGAEQFYTVANNKERSEGLEKARLVDKRVVQAWTGHPHLRVINNHENFEAKINRVIKEIASVLGLRQPITEERKYVVQVLDSVPDAIESHIVQTYLSADPNTETRLRQRSWNGKRVYVLTTKTRVSEHEIIETERQISSAVYHSLLQQADPYRQTIRKNRKSFIWQGQYFELDSFEAPIRDLIILESKGVEANEEVKFPPFLKIIKDITANTDYYNYNLALKHSL